MANKEHLEILMQGVEAWNKWRYRNNIYWHGIPDLKESNLEGLNLEGADLSSAYLDEANLTGANLTGANLVGSRFKGAKLQSANLSDTDLRETRDLKKADLRGVNLSRANLSQVDLCDANLSNAIVENAEFWHTELRKANFQGANLSGADLRGANLNIANFREANLSNAILLTTQALATDFSNAIFTGACLEDWHTNTSTNLDGVVCDYIYRKFASYHNHSERRPHSRNFKPGEFTKLYRKALETVDIVFLDGIEWKAFLVSFLELKAQTGSDEISIQSFENRNGAFIVRINVPFDADKAKIERFIEDKYQVILDAKDKEIVLLSKGLASERQANIDLRRILEIMAEKENSKYYFDKVQIGNFVDTAQSGSRQQSINHQHNYAPEQKQTLVDAAAEIQQRLAQLQAQGYSPEAAQEQVASDLAKRVQTNPEEKSKLAKWGQYLGDAAANGLIGEAVVIVLKSAAQLAGIPIP